MVDSARERIREIKREKENERERQERETDRERERERDSESFQAKFLAHSQLLVTNELEKHFGR